MLEGSERQVKYATDILNYVVYQIENSNANEDKKAKFITALKRQKKSEFIIDNFAMNFKLQDVRSRALDFFEYRDLEKVTQKELKSFRNTVATIDEKIKDLKFITEKLAPKKNEKVKETIIDNKKSNKAIKVENQTKKVARVNYFDAKYDGVDCETGEHIYEGNLIWRDSQGIHKADNY